MMWYVGFLKHFSSFSLVNSCGFPRFVKPRYQAERNRTSNRFPLRVIALQGHGWQNRVCLQSTVFFRSKYFEVVF